MDGSPSRPVWPVAAKKGPSERKIGIVCQSMMEKDYEIKLYVVDIDVAVEEEYAPVKPAVRFLFPARRSVFAVCVLESTVYMFGGYNPNGNKPSDPKKKYAKKFELSDKVFPNGDLLVKEEELVEIRSMRYAKGDLCAIPTPDGKKIIVFQTSTRRGRYDRAFELYDPKEDSWERLPGPLSWTDSDSDSESESESGSDPDSDRQCSLGELRAYSFVDESHFYIETEGGSYALDIVNKKWKTLMEKGLVREEGYFVAAKDSKGAEYALTSGSVFWRSDNKYVFPESVHYNGGDIIFTPGDLYYIGEGGFLSYTASVDDQLPLPLSSFTPPNLGFYVSFWDSSICPLHPFLIKEEGEEICNTCVLQVEVDYGKMEARMLIDVCRSKLGTSLQNKLTKCLRLSTTISFCIRRFNLISI